MADLKDYSKQTTKRLVFGFISILIVVGLGLVAIIWGIPAAVSGFLCILAGGIPILLIWLILWVVDRVVKNSRS
jgi:hypothetical protein